MCVISENLCGNICTNGSSICTCGNTNRNRTEMRKQRIYCCNTIPCETIGEFIICKTGVEKNVDEKCGNECPIAEGK